MLNEMVSTEIGRMFVSDEHEIERAREEGKNLAKIKEDTKARNKLRIVNQAYVNDGEDIVKQAKANLAAARSYQAPCESRSFFNSRWHPWQESMYQRAMRLRYATEVLHHAQLEIPFDHRQVLPNPFEALNSMRGVTLSGFPMMAERAARLSDNPNSISDTLFEIDGKFYSNIFYYHLHAFLSCMHYARNPKKIVEIGGGYGALCRLFILDGIVERYVIVDLPESLFYSEVALRSEFPDSVGYWNGSDPGTKIVLIPTSRMTEYKKSADLVLNQGSFQEMSDDWVTHYMSWLDEFDTKYFYALNYAGSPLSHMFESRTLWAPRPSPKFTTCVVNSEIPIVKMQCEGRYFAEMFYEKKTPVAKFSNWSVLNGGFLTRQSYLEGLELIRQDGSVENLKTFLQILLECDGAGTKPFFAFPKEGAFLALLLKQNGVSGVDELVAHCLEAPKFINA